MEFKKKIFKTFKTLKGYDGLYVIKNSKEYLQICKKKKTEKVIKGDFILVWGISYGWGRRKGAELIQSAHQFSSKHFNTELMWTGCSKANMH